MKYTNDQFLPSAVYDAISAGQDRESRRGHADISVTELIGPPRIKQLMDRFGDKIEVDAADRVRPFIGTAIHRQIASAARGRAELQLYSQWSGTERMWVVSGTIDLVDEDDVLWDYKYCKWEAARIDQQRAAWEAQINLYNLLCGDNGIEVAEMKVWAIYSDYSPAEKYRRHNYPPSESEVIPMRMWAKESTEAYVQWRLTEHEKNFPLCTPEERWSEPDTWALMVEGSPRAVRTGFTTELEARLQMEARKQTHPNKAYYIEQRIAMSKRCKYYCPVWQFCDYGYQERTQPVGGPP